MIYMKKFRLIDKRERNANEELKEYTFEELKTYFEPNKEDLPEDWEEWSKIEKLFELEKFLEFEAQGMAVPYEFEEIEVEDENRRFY